MLVAVIEATGGGTPAERGDCARDYHEPRFRYAVVLWLMLAVVVFVIAAPTASWSRAVAIAIEGVAVLVTIVTSRERRAVRRREVLLVAPALLGDVVLIGLGILPTWIISLSAVLITVAVPVTLTRGLLRLLDEHGVTLPAVAGSLAIYVSIGLVFAWTVGLIAQLANTPYFAQHTNGTQGQKVYFSFATLTTSGFGDLTPATPVGHAVAVIEMLVGQLYLVTVIGLLIGNFAGRRRSP